MPGAELIVGFANATAPSNMNRADLRTMEIIASLQQTQVRLTSISPLPHKQIVMGFGNIDTTPRKCQSASLRL
jgi:hypothetical protein